MTASRATLLQKAQDLGIALPSTRMGITAKELQALIREHNAMVKSVRKSPPIDPTPNELKRKRAPRSSANAAPSAKVVPIARTKNLPQSSTVRPSPPPPSVQSKRGASGISWRKRCCARTARRSRS